jgi:hypothetical protein
MDGFKTGAENIHLNASLLGLTRGGVNALFDSNRGILRCRRFHR